MAYVGDATTDFVPPAEVGEVELYHAKSFITKYVFSQDAKTIAFQYVGTALAIGIVGLTMSGLMRLQLGFPTNGIIDPAEYLMLFSMHGMIMVIFLLTALFLGGFGNYLIPLMVGARDMAFPFVNMMSYWIYLMSVLVLLSSFYVEGGPTGAGWTLYPPQSIMSGTPGSGMGISLMLTALVLFVIGFTMGGLNYAVTVLQCRTRGLTMMRLPLSAWGIFCATILALFGFPALLVGGFMMLLDRMIGTSFFMPVILEFGEYLSYDGGSPILFQHLFWFFGHPEVYIVALPAFGIVSDIISIHARKVIFGYRMMVWCIVGIGAVSFVVWAHHMYVSGMNPWFGFLFASTTLVIAIPTALKIYNWLLTLWKGNIQLTTPMLYALGFLVQFVNGGITGLFCGNTALDIPISDTMFVVGHFHLAMGLAPLLVVFGSVHHWYPLMTGRFLDATLGKIHFWITFLGTYALFFPQHYIGFNGVPRRYFDIGGTNHIVESTLSVRQFVSYITWIVLAAQLIFIYNIFKSYSSGKIAGKNPWKANSLEWQTATVPPGHGNFPEEMPLVYRWPYDFSVPGVKDDYIPQNLHPGEVVMESGEKATA